MNGFVCLGKMFTVNGQSQVDARRRIQAGANVWRKTDGHMLDRRNSKDNLTGTC